MQASAEEEETGETQGCAPELLPAQLWQGEMLMVSGH